MIEDMMNVLFYFILISILPILANLSGFLVSKWSFEELKSLKKYLSLSVRMIFLFILLFNLINYYYFGLIIFIIFIIFAFSKKFWKFENFVILIFAMYLLLAPSVFLLIMLFVYFLIVSTLMYYDFFKSQEVRFHLYPLFGISFIKKYWTYYVFLLVLQLTLFVLFLLM